MVFDTLLLSTVEHTNASFTLWDTANILLLYIRENDEFPKGVHITPSSSTVNSSNITVSIEKISSDLWDLA